MLKIRLQRLGRKNRPIYRVIVAEHSDPVKGRYVDELGHYNPLMKEGGFQIDQETMKLWISKGAKPTNTIARLCVGIGMADMKPFVVEMKNRRKKNAPEEEVAPPAPVAAPPAPVESAPAEKPLEDAPKEEVKAEEELKEEPKKEEQEPTGKAGPEPDESPAEKPSTDTASVEEEKGAA